MKNRIPEILLIGFLLIVLFFFIYATCYGDKLKSEICMKNDPDNYDYCMMTQHVMVDEQQKDYSL